MTNNFYHNLIDITVVFMIEKLHFILLTASESVTKHQTSMLAPLIANPVNRQVLQYTWITAGLVINIYKIFVAIRFYRL